MKKLLTWLLVALCGVFMVPGCVIITAKAESVPFGEDTLEKPEVTIDTKVKHDTEDFGYP